MKIVETNIPAINEFNIDLSKVELANSIIQNVYPLFDEIYSEKSSELKQLKGELEKKKERIIENKNKIEELFKVYTREKKVKKLLIRIAKLLNSGLLYDGSLKNETLILLKVIDSLNDEKLDFHLQETMRIINKRFS
jgi:hypothetical protein